ncbi:MULTISPECIES: hypothetical protein [Kordiimonas]|uniref:hypothetical protein n=1 Tax=Kordiimonas TaxID=288021 RepID=UPI002579F2C5|nr:hypothetical protein [Kordiimonas sp. UBA4487]
MTVYFLMAGLVCLVTTAFHVFAGGARVVRPMLASQDLNDTMKAVLYGCWHAFTLLYLGVAAVFIWAGFTPSGVLPAAACAVMAAMLAILSAAVIRRFGQRFWRLPHWLLFSLAALSGALGVMSA